ncbi:WecB/TagA/CpsF family glycosyltransferase [Desulfovibrio inopinatus]|uniref:WecB/TagA/CpsF family glycosyltransferase n=1 Tax=Desulfovibrio inopinatus TaxID=102109 RepID=UPI0003F9FF39|nr:WecB/TagA/CpsF family glycosyltransferase [Desulfovibrio inopinatus]
MTTSYHRDLVVVAGIPIDNLTTSQVIERIEIFIASGQPHYVATANVNFIAMALSDPEFSDVVRMADIITPDGMPVVWAARQLGKPVQERVTGADLVPALCALAARKGYSVFFLGGATGIAEAAVANLKKLHPELNAHYYSPDFNPLLEMEHDTILEAVQAAAPDMLFVSFGAGKAEKWIRMHLHKLDVPVAMGVGATVDFLAGRVRRAPAIIQRLGLEWFFRLAMEPRRMFRRYLYDGIIFFRAITAQLAHQRQMTRQTHNEAVLDIHTETAGTIAVVALSGRLDAIGITRMQEECLPFLQNERPFLLDMSRVSFLDSSGLGALVALEKQARSHNDVLRLVAPSSVVLQTFRLARLKDYFTIYESVDELPPSTFPKRLGGMKKYVIDNETLTIHLEGRFDASVADSIKTELLTLSESSSQIQHLVLNMAKTSFIDSAGISVLIALHRILHQNGGQLEFEQLSSAVQQTFTLVKIDRYLNILSSH